MEAIALNAGSYEGTYKLVGEEVSLDFVNTISWPGMEREHDLLDRPENFTAWAHAAGLLPKSKVRALNDRSAAVNKHELEQVHKIRNDLYKVLRPLAFNEAIPAAAIEKLDRLIRTANQQRKLDAKTHQWTWVEAHSFVEVLAPVIWNAGWILTDTDHSRIKHCPSCDWIFYDNTRNGSRRWCDMEDCGSRDKALRYYHRKSERNK